MLFTLPDITLPLPWTLALLQVQLGHACLAVCHPSDVSLADAQGSMLYCISLWYLTYYRQELHPDCTLLCAECLAQGLAVVCISKTLAVSMLCSLLSSYMTL